MQGGHEHTQLDRGNPGEEDETGTAGGRDGGYISIPAQQPRKAGSFLLWTPPSAQSHVASRCLPCSHERATGRNVRNVGWICRSKKAGSISVLEMLDSSSRTGISGPSFVLSFGRKGQTELKLAGQKKKFVG